MSPPLLLHFTGKPSRASEWGRCPECVTWYTENRLEVIRASAKDGLVAAMGAMRAVDAFMRGRHAKH